MTEVVPSELKKAVESQHGGFAHFVQFVPVHEQHCGETVWNGTVAVFDLKSSPSGCDCAYEMDDGRRMFFSVLHPGPIDSPAAAIKAAMLAEAKSK